MPENIVLVLFILLPILLAGLLSRFFKRISSTQKNGSSGGALVLGNGLVFLFLCSLVLLGGEVYYRFIFDTTDSFALTKVTQKWFATHYRLNKSGFRDSLEGFKNSISNGKQRITFVGDSFTEGHGIANVEDRFGNRIRQLRPDWEVHVFSSGGWDTGHEVLMVKELSESDYKLDRLVLVYCLNDIADIVPEWRKRLEKIYSSPLPFFAQHSYFLNLYFIRWTGFRNPDVADYYQFVRKAYAGPVWEQQKIRLDRIRKMVVDKKGQLLVVTFPFLHALGPQYAYQEVHQQLSNFWNNLKVSHLDLLNIYMSHAKEDLVINKFDAHPNEKAHGIAAKAIVQFLDRDPASS